MEIEKETKRNSMDIGQGPVPIPFLQLGKGGLTKAFDLKQPRAPDQRLSKSAREPIPCWRKSRIQQSDSALIQTARSNKPIWNISVRAPDLKPAIRVVTHVPSEGFGDKYSYAWGSRNNRGSKSTNLILKVAETCSKGDSQSTESNSVPQPPQLHKRTIRYMTPVGTNLLLTCSDDGTAALIRSDQTYTESEQFACVFAGHSGGVLHGCRYNENFIATASEDKTVRLWNIRDPGLCQVFLGHKAPVTKVAAVAVEKELVSCSSDRTIRIWDTTSRQAKKVISGLSNRSLELFIFPRCSYAIVLVECGGKISAWDRQNGQVFWSDSRTEEINCTDISAEENSFCMGCKDGTLLNYYLKSPTTKSDVEDNSESSSGTLSCILQAEQGIISIKYAGPTLGAAVVTGHISGLICVHDLASSACLHKVRVHDSWVMHLSIGVLPYDGMWKSEGSLNLFAASSCFDGTISLTRFDAESAEKVLTRSQHQSTAFRTTVISDHGAKSPRMKVFSVGADGQLQLFVHVPDRSSLTQQTNRVSSQPNQ